MSRPNTGISLNPDKKPWSKGRNLDHENLRKILDYIAKGVHPQVAAAAQGWLPEEFEELLGSNEKFRRLMIKHFARYEIKRAAQVDESTDSKTAMAYLERCRKNWSRKVDVSLRPLAKKALDSLEVKLKERRQLTGEEAWDMVLDAFANESAHAVFD